MPQPNFEKRENRGASPVAIEYAEHIKRGLDDPALAQYRQIHIASMIDAAIRKAGAPELYAAAQFALGLELNRKAGVVVTDKDYNELRERLVAAIKTAEALT